MSTALYRRYRPERFEDVIGQEHVTVPLQHALANDRVHHAYLFSGPRGCGKTTSARILARCLNCERGPTPTPCGECRSCLELARGGSGNLDVVEIDAASHGGVDDARDLREKAFFAPASSRFKIYIIDEAHMVTSQGFNALLKIVEEPPPHLKFVFATTEPEKVIGTIRSRTHHYPFRLVPPRPLQDYLEKLCGAEGISVDRTVLPLVVRAGGGSVRDSLSVLDQLLAGAGPAGVTYDLAVGLLGYTDAALLDDVVDAFAAGDGAEVFRIVDRVVEAGHNPRRFVEDLLERLRDLIVLDAVPDAASSILGDVPEDQLERMRGQAARFGAGALTRAADLVNTGLTEMRGTTAPRLQLELICARVLLPAAYNDERSLAARLDRLERRLAIGGEAAGVVSGGPASGAVAGGAGAGAGTVGAVEGPAVGGRGGAGAARAAVRRAVPAPDAAPTAADAASTAPNAASTASDAAAVDAAAPAAAPSAAPGARGDQRGAADSPSSRRAAPAAPAAPAPAASEGTPGSDTTPAGHATPATQGRPAPAGAPAQPPASRQAAPEGGAADRRDPQWDLNEPEPDPAADPGPDPWDDVDVRRPGPSGRAATEPRRDQADGSRDQQRGGRASAPGRAGAQASGQDAAGASGAAEAAPRDPAPRDAAPDDTAAPSPASAGLDLAAVRRLWPDVLERVKGMKRLTWTLLLHNAQVLSVDGRVLVLGMVNAGARDSFSRGGSPEIVRQALIDVLGVDWKVEAVVDPTTESASAAPPRPRPEPRHDQAPERAPASPGASASAREAVATAPAAGSRAQAPAAEAAPVDDTIDRDDPDADDGGLTGRELLARELGAQVIDEYDESEAR